MNTVMPNGCLLGFHFWSLVCLVIAFRQGIAQAPKTTLPKLSATMTFAGEAVPLDDSMVVEGELIKNVYKQSATLTILKRVGLYRKQMVEILNENQVPEDFFYVVDERRHLILSTQAAGKYFNSLNKSFKNWTLTAAAFNGGRRMVLENVKAQKVSSFYDLYLNPETTQVLQSVAFIPLIVGVRRQIRHRK